MALNDARVLFGYGSSTNYAAIASKDQNTMYFLSDTKEIYVGSERFALGELAVEFRNEAGDVLTNVEGMVVTGVALDPASNSKTLVITFGTGVNASVTTEVKEKLKAAVAGSKVLVADENANIDLKTSNKGNVKFTADDDGLSANVEIPEDQVLGVKAGDKVLKLGDGKLLETAIGLTYDSAAHKIHLTGLNNEVIATVDAADFIKDGMVSNVEYDADTRKATITFNTDAGKDAIEVDFSTLVDTYTAGAGLKVENNEFAIDNTVAPTADEADVAKALAFGEEVEIKTAKYNAQGLVVGQKSTKITLPTLPKTTTVGTASSDEEFPTAKAVETRVAAAEKTAADNLDAAKEDLEGKISGANQAAASAAEAADAAIARWTTF